MGREQSGGGQREVPARPEIYCVIPRALAPKLYELLRQHFRDHPTVGVVVERRSSERRSAHERRQPVARSPRAPTSGGRRVIRSLTGRRVGGRRADTVAVDGPSLPRKARPYRDRLAFVERIELSEQELEDLDTARLVAGFQAGDTDVFAVLYMRYFDRVFGYLRMLLRNPHDAEEAAQQVFIRVFQALPSYEHRRPFWVWLVVVLRNYAVDDLRKRGRLELADPGEIDRWRERGDGGEHELRALSWISDRDLVVFVERLPLAQRQVLLLRYMFDLTTAEIAAVMQRSPSDVRVLQHRALNFLRARLAAVGRCTGRSRPIPWRRRVVKAQVLRARRSALLG
jgi:RNA polymerase sigma-70 factor (ECF subfamily)